MITEYRPDMACKLLSAFLFALLWTFLCPLSAGQDVTDETLDFAINDATLGGSPLEVHGNALIHEVISGRQIESAWGANVVVRNVSSKPITLLFATLTELGRHPKGGHTGGLDDGPTYIIVEDRFFSADIEPSDSVVLRDTKPGALSPVCCVESTDEVRSPEAKFTVIFVQYADGSIFGDPTAATDVFARRKASVGALSQLAESQADGEKSFGERIDRQCALLGSICPQISQVFERNGEREALMEIRRLLGISQKRAGLLRSYSAN
ncbi:MAG: hypothetical protein ACRD2U_11375 [Terriglobales bacterium]